MKADRPPPMASRGSHGLRTYILRRILLMLPTMVGVTLIVFFLCQLMPGGPIDQYRLQFLGAGGGEAGGGGSKVSSTHDISETNLQSLKEYYGFDKPVAVRYFRYVGNLAQGDLGRSFRYSMPVMELIGMRLPISIYYGLVTTILTYLICIPLGMVKAIRHKTWVDNATSLLIFIGYAIPGFALGAVLIVVF